MDQPKSIIKHVHGSQSLRLLSNRELDTYSLFALIYRSGQTPTNFSNTTVTFGIIETPFCLNSYLA